MRAGAELFERMPHGFDESLEQMSVADRPWIQAWDGLRMWIYAEVRDVVENPLVNELARTIRSKERNRWMR